MYVVTFYSFKGGVGRTMALVNVAAELASRGKRVLVVDFDLEAPGLDTFDITASENAGRGLLDFVNDFRSTGEVPDVREYVYQAPFRAGQLLVMPAGLQDNDYHNRFRSIDWAELYRERHGFLLFEDLKAQWKDALKVDYVLIDSRTGHTDVSGICTRQLPQAVVLLFYPNEQNRRGLQTIVSQIRSEAKGPLKKKIDLHFVMSNVPYIDDEQEILEGELQRFEDSLEFLAPSAVIHHYDSLALVEQETFNITHPRSRLAKEYAELTLTIVRENLEDRVGALAFLDRVRRQSRRGTIVPDLEMQLQEIRLKHAGDTEVLEKLADTRSRQKKSGEALAILTQALNTGVKEPEILLRRAQLYSSLNQKDKSVADLKEILSSNEATSSELGVVIRMLREIQPDLVQLISRSPVLERIDSDIDFIRELEASPETLSLAVQLLSRWLPTLINDESAYIGFRNELLLCLIGKGSYADVVAIFGESRKAPDELKLPNLFNYTMALWGLEGEAPINYLSEIAKSTQDYAEDQDPNHLQCFSLVNHLLGNFKVAEELLNRGFEVNLARGASSFSCWSYLKVSVERFSSDLEEMNVAFKSNLIIPEFIRRNSPALPAQFEFPRRDL